ncbi:MAG TPA: hypothetical protein VER98_18915 [Terriglobia bacterium]|nr:hypothetical protein [Terriglobia bacterium]
MKILVAASLLVLACAFAAHVAAQHEEAGVPIVKADMTNQNLGSSEVTRGERAQRGRVTYTGSRMGSGERGILLAGTRRHARPAQHWDNAHRNRGIRNKVTRSYCLVILKSPFTLS